MLGAGRAAGRPAPDSRRARRCGSAKFACGRDPDCPVCGEHPTIRELQDYEQFCGRRPAARGRRTSDDFDITPRRAEGAARRRRRRRCSWTCASRWSISITACRARSSIPLGELPAPRAANWTPRRRWSSTATTASAASGRSSSCGRPACGPGTSRAASPPGPTRWTRPWSAVLTRTVSLLFPPEPHKLRLPRSYLRLSLC